MSLYDRETAMEQELNKLYCELLACGVILGSVEQGIVTSKIEQLENALGYRTNRAAPVKKCECGSTAAGFSSHVHWCPLHTPFK